MTSSAQPVAHKRVRASEFSDHVGKIYFLANISCQTVKVGFTRNLSKRVFVLQTGNHNRLEVCCVLNAPPHIERGIQKALVKFKIRNEWFDHNACVDDLIRKFEEFEVERGCVTGDFSPVIADDDLSMVMARWQRDWPCEAVEKLWVITDE